MHRGNNLDACVLAAGAAGHWRTFGQRAMVRGIPKRPRLKHLDGWTFFGDVVARRLIDVTQTQSTQLLLLTVSLLLLLLLLLGNHACRTARLVVAMQSFRPPKVLTASSIVPPTALYVV
jgi:hypothetical protein